MFRGITMRRLIVIVLSTFVAFSITACSSHSTKSETPLKPTPLVSTAETQDIHVMSTANINGKITGTSIEDAFAANGFVVDESSDMNKLFSLRFAKTWHHTYRLTTVHHQDITAKLATKYPSIGLITPLSISIWSSNDNKGISLSSLTLRGMSRITKIPMTNPDLIAYAGTMDKAIKAALPSGKYELREYKNVADMHKQLVRQFTVEFPIDTNTTANDDAADNFVSTFIDEIQPVGFKFTNHIDLNADLKERGVTAYEYYDTYSVNNLAVIFPVSQKHPEACAFTPFTFYIYKKKGEKETNIGYQSVENTLATDIEDKASIQALKEAQELFSNTLIMITK